MKKVTKVFSILLMLALCMGTVACGSKENTAPDVVKPKETASTEEVKETGEAVVPEDVNKDGTVNNPEDVTAADNEIIFWSLFSGGDGDFMDQIIKDYNATNPAYKVKSVKLVWADYYTKLKSAIAAGKGPDLGISHVSRLPELVSTKAIQSFESDLSWADYSQGAKDNVTYDGAVYAVPLDVHGVIAYLNTDLFEAAGISTDINFTNPEDFKKLLTQLKDKLPEGVWPLAMDNVVDYPYRYWWTVYFSMGGTPFLSKEGKVTLDPVIAAKAAEFVKSLFDEGFIPPNLQSEEQDKIFQAKQAALIFTGTWCIGKFSATEGLNFKTAVIPSLFGEESALADSHTFIIPTNKNRDDTKTKGAIDFAVWASVNGGLTWAQSGQIPANNKVAESKEYKDLPYRADYAYMAQIADFPPQSEYFSVTQTTIMENLDMFWSGSATAKDIENNLVKDIESAID